MKTNRRTSDRESEMSKPKFEVGDLVRLIIDCEVLEVYQHQGAPPTYELDPAGNGFLEENMGLCENQPSHKRLGEKDEY